jgi:hypothetical protein
MVRPAAFLIEGYGAANTGAPPSSARFSNPCSVA